MARNKLATAAWLSSATLTLLVGCTQESGTSEAFRISDETEPSQIAYVHDELADALTDPVLVENLSITTSPQDGQFVVHFAAASQPFELQMRENWELLSPAFEVIRDGVSMTAAEADLAIPLKGQVAGDPNSWVRGRFVEGKLEGLIYFDNRLLELRHDPWAPEVLLLGDATMTDYLPFGGGGNFRCGTVVPEVDPGNPDDYVDHRVGANCEAIQIGLVADYTFVNQLGGESQAESEMVARLNETEGMYRADINYSFELMEVQTFPNQGGPSFNTASTGNTPLTEFSSWKGQNMASYGLAHLNVARTSSGAVGLAYVGQTCATSNGTGVSNYLGTGRSSTIVVAHEIGHNVGSGHDSSGAPYIMAPSVNSSATTFSPQSKNDINSHLGSRSCLVPCDGGGDEDGEESSSDGGEESSSDGGEESSGGGGEEESSDGGEESSDGGEESSDGGEESSDGGEESSDGGEEEDSSDGGEEEDSSDGGEEEDSSDGGEEEDSSDGGEEEDSSDGGEEEDSDGGEAEDSDDVADEGDGGTNTDPPPTTTTTTSTTTTTTATTTASGFTPAEPTGCACTTAPSRTGPAGAALMWIGLLGLTLRRRRSTRA